MDDCEHSSEKQEGRAYHATISARARMYGRLHSPRQTGATPLMTSPQPPRFGSQTSYRMGA